MVASLGVPSKNTTEAATAETPMSSSVLTKRTAESAVAVLEPNAKHCRLSKLSDKHGSLASSSSVSSLIDYPVYQLCPTSVLSDRLHIDETSFVTLNTHKLAGSSTTAYVTANTTVLSVSDFDGKIESEINISGSEDETVGDSDPFLP